MKRAYIIYLIAAPIFMIPIGLYYLYYRQTGGLDIALIIPVWMLIWGIAAYFYFKKHDDEK